MYGALRSALITSAKLKPQPREPRMFETFHGPSGLLLVAMLVKNGGRLALQLRFVLLPSVQPVHSWLGVLPVPLAVAIPMTITSSPLLPAVWLRVGLVLNGGNTSPVRLYGPSGELETAWFTCEFVNQEFTPHWWDHSQV